MEIETINKSISGSTIRDDEAFMNLVKQSLTDFEVFIWNGAEVPTKKTLPEAFTCISSDVKELKAQSKENNILLSGIKKRKKITIAFFELFTTIKEWIKSTTFGKIVFSLAVYGIVIKGMFSLLKDFKIFQFISNLFSKF